MTLRLVSYNIHSGVGTDGRQDYRRIGQFLAEQAVDIALIQEMDTRDPERAIDADIADICSGHFQWLIPSPTITEPDGWYGNAILTRYPAVFTNVIDVSQGGFQPRNIQEAIVQTGAGPLHLINTHKGLKKLERRRQLALLDQRLKQLDTTSIVPLVVGGDFNEWQFFTDAFRTIDAALGTHPVGRTFPTRCPLFKLDRVWTRPKEIALAAKVLRTPKSKCYSDHYPVQIDISLGD